jgi:hypothetical protein
LLRSPPIPSLDEVPRNIDAKHVCAKFRLGQCRGAIAAAEIEHLESFRDSESLHQRLSAFAHGIGNAREIAFFPECFVWICGSIHNVRLSVGFVWSQLFRAVTKHNNRASRKQFDLFVR